MLPAVLPVLGQVDPSRPGQVDPRQLAWSLAYRETATVQLVRLNAGWREWLFASRYSRSRVILVPVSGRES